MEKALTLALLYGCDAVVVETDQGGQAFDSVFIEAWRAVLEHAGLVLQQDALRRPTFVPVKPSRSRKT